MRRVALVLLALALAAPASAQASTTGRLLVSLAPPPPGTARAAAATAVAARAGARLTGRAVPHVGLVTVRARRGESLHALAERLRRDPSVRAVDVEHRATLRALPDDPAMSEGDPGAPGLSLEWWAQREDFPAAWARADGAGVTIAVIDSGVDASHPELAPKIRRSIDLDSDPSHGAPTVDENGHGTHVASLACAQPGNGTGLAGAGYDCGLIVEKSDLTDASVVAAVVDATDHGAGVISMSIGTDGRSSPPQAMIDAMHYAYDHGVVLVAAAADKPTAEQGDPANILQPTNSGSNPDAGIGLSVTAAEPDDQRAPFAGYGSQISLAAYGAVRRNDGPDGLLGAFPPATAEMELGSDPCLCRAIFDGDRRYAFLQGTSMATPIVAGAAALVRDVNPDLGPADVIHLLKTTARRPSGRSWTPDLGWGIVDAQAAVDAATRLDRRPPTSSVRAPSTTRRRWIRLRVSAKDTAAPGVRVSGVRSVRIYRSVDGHPAHWAATTGGHVVRLRARPGARYAFYSQAVDRDGNVEPAPTTPDAATRVARRG